MVEFNSFESIKIGLCSPENVLEWSYGEVRKPETINYRTQKPEKDGLFCEKIFGPQRDWECHCGKYKRIRYKGVICDRCGVEVTKSKVRRERMGHITLAAPVSHIWYFKGIPSRMGLLLDVSPKYLENVLYFASYIVTDPGKTRELSLNQILSEVEYREAKEKFGDKFKAEMGAEAVKTLLANLDLDALSNELKEDIKNTSSQGQKRAKLIKRLEAAEAFRMSGNKPEWMILNVLPVIPPDLRPMVQLDGGRFAASDLNDLYRRVINRNNRLKKLLELNAPEIIVRNEKRMLQEAVDALIDNGRRGKPVTGAGNRPLKSLSDMLKGKQGRFRQNLLGKRVDYSGRSVIVVGPELKIYQCGLPKEMALELFKPFVMKRLHDSGKAHNIKSAKRMVERVKDEVWDILAEVIKEHPVLLNRAPTLHRLGIQAFEPVLVEGKALRLHPLVCTAYNADFDGDQMAVHVPLSVEAQAEARFLMLSANNLLKPQDGKPVTVPTQDMILGSYYLTIENKNEIGAPYFIDERGNKVENPEEGKDYQTHYTVFGDYDEARLAYENGVIGLHAPIKVRVQHTVDDKIVDKFLECTVGRIIFNEYIPQDLGFVDRENPENDGELEIQFNADKKALGKIIEKCIEVHGITKTAVVLDDIKSNGFKYSTKGAITVGISDMEVPVVKAKLIKDTEKKIKEVEKAFKRGLLTEEDRYDNVVKLWTETIDDVTNALMEHLDETNPIYMMADSGARGSKNQIRQLAGMRGLMADTSGKTVEIPIKANFREGLNVLEYFISTHGARKGLADTALRTADSGYLTRRLVDVSQDVIIRQDDCQTLDGLTVQAIKGIEPLSERLIGRYLIDNIVNKETGELICDNNTMISAKMAKIIEDYMDTFPNLKDRKVKIRSVLGCKAKYGVCSKCYGANLASGAHIDIGEAVGIIAAQSIGEPGTQLTMRTFHTGGVAGGDITQGLPRIEELFEARKPKGCTDIFELSGKVSVTTDHKREVTVTAKDGEAKTYKIPYGYKIIVTDGEDIEAGDPLTEGPINPHDVLRIKGVFSVWEYLISEVQKVYRLQGVDINDKHIEVIVRQMMRKIRLLDTNDTDLFTGSLIDMVEFNEKNRVAVEKGGVAATGDITLLGITKASLATDSFLSAASFQETTRVLTDAAIKGKTDPLIGLKENVILGKLIPAGTGMQKYQDTQITVNHDVY